MTRSLRSRLILGMLLGMTVLLIAANVTIYTVQRRQLYRAFDDTLLNSANALALLIHHGPFGCWFDSNGLSRLPAGRIREGALYQFWSDRPIGVVPPDLNPEFFPDGKGFPGPGWDDGLGPEPPFSGMEPPRGPRPGRPPPEPPGPGGRRWPGEDEEGVLLIRSPLLNGADLPRLNPPAGRPQFQDITLPGNARGRAVGVHLKLTPPGPEPYRDPPVNLTMVVAADTAEVDRQLHFLTALLIVTALATMAIAGGVAWLVVSRGLRPLAAVAKDIAAMDETGLKQRIDPCGVPREIEPVVSQLNGLLERLDEAFDRERALTADVAHELRTPVAEIRTISEITLSRPREPEEYRRALGESLDTIKTLQGLMEKLLVLARMEAGQMRPELEPLAVRPFLLRHWAQFQSRVADRGLTLDDRCSADFAVSADARLLDVVLSNVLSNAVVHSPDGGQVSVDVQRDDTRGRLCVATTGCVLSEEEAARVFDRFWRADAARSAGGLHCGLGLTLVRRAMEAMGGTAEAAVTPDRRFILTLTFRSAEHPEDTPEPR